MSFSSGVKKELFTVTDAARHCRMAECAGIAGATGAFSSEGDMIRIPETPELAEKLFTSVRDLFNIDLSGNGNAGPGDIAKVREVLLDETLLARECCRRAFLRGVFLATGSISSPEHSYHLELALHDESFALKVLDVMERCRFRARSVPRKQETVVYLKEGEQIVAFLGKIGATVSLLNLENIRVERQMRGVINRRVNCETANLKKTVVSSLRQIEDVKFIRDMTGFRDLSPMLRMMAEVRLEYPDATLSELGRLMDPPIGKSGVNHRLRRLAEVAEELRKGK